MSIRPLVLVLVVVLALGIIGRALGAGRRSGRPRPAAPESITEIRRHLWRWRLASLFVGVAVGVVLLQVKGTAGLDLGRVALLAPAAGAVLVLLGNLAAEMTSPMRRAGVRTAALQARSPGALLDRRLAVEVGTLLVALGATLALGIARGIPDDRGHPGRAVATRGCARELAPDGNYQELASTGSHGPWPGSWYAVPLAIALGAVLLAAVLCLVAVARRPRPAADVAEADDALRRWSAANVLHVVGFAAAGSLWPVAAAVASGLGADQPCGSGPSSMIWVFFLLALVGLVGAVRHGLALFRGPRPAVPVGAPS